MPTRNRALAFQAAGKGNNLMAIRHDVENLTRRGNIFYWRARVPSAFGKCQQGNRLSLSLHCSDHKKAQAIGRKLNMLVAELILRWKKTTLTLRQVLSSAICFIADFLQ